MDGLSWVRFTDFGKFTPSYSFQWPLFQGRLHRSQRNSFTVSRLSYALLRVFPLLTSCWSNRLYSKGAQARQSVFTVLFYITAFRLRDFLLPMSPRKCRRISGLRFYSRIFRWCLYILSLTVTHNVTWAVPYVEFPQQSSAVARLRTLSVIAGWLIVLLLPQC